MNNNKNILSASLAALFLVSAQSHACLTNEIESNNIESSANKGICSGTLIEGSMSRADIDWFEFNVSSAGEININLDHNSRDDFDWSLYQTSGSAVVQAQTSQVPETGSYQALGSGTYLLKVTRYSGSGWYDLTINYPEGNTEPPSNNTCEYGSRPSKSSTLKTYLLGDQADSCSELNTENGAVLLMGGGSDVDNAFINRVGPHVGQGADVVVLRTSGTDAYNDYLLGLLDANSVETLIVDSRNKANEPYVDWAIRSAEFVWVSGGDQSEYLNQWQGTSLQSALQYVFDKGGVIGGTSAGMALMANSIYDPDGIQGAVSNEVVTDFCHNTLQFNNRFVSVPMLDNSLTDTHFKERDRMGRSLVSLAHHATTSFAIAASEATSIFITTDGKGIVDGSAEVYILKESEQTIRKALNCGQAVEYSGISRIKLLAGDTYNFSNHSHIGSNITIGIDGRISNFYTPINPY
ncbi:Type 1 glutamine amidotransferase-like domain-containing protein [Pseudoalteromonas tunicata]|uniref:Cyanophycinase and related exopeptidase-like protein n=1 Tax=Pseudoalteromonas tunicata D2 TaxID=87626 RepID=A4CAD9_9GAMM|nr:Type 1 glutamine amidotransferase-like domain-containing protein [Pseudoalteromonas tunicata]ATC94896.1 hypothetical protein PTUN_a2412 [Pseudoalteromonas tunicata]AXT30572.1 cyanophycinase [Pseudoalteromonas tunicata]EAR28347.1 Cyanophycinase and related exopeptidase-like protein [Pseudoalteromonas tunicata D2]